MKKVRIVRSVAIVIGCYAVMAFGGWLLGAKVAGPAIERLNLGEDAEN